MLGFDTLWHNDLGDAALVALAVAEQRILLTGDRRLLMRRAVSQGCLVRAGQPLVQLAYVIERLQLCAEIAPFSRCLVCNGLLGAVPPAAAVGEVPPRVWARQRAYWRCQDCRRLYWRGSHWAAMRRRILALCPGFPLRGEGDDLAG